MINGIIILLYILVTVSGIFTAFYHDKRLVITGEIIVVIAIVLQTLFMFIVYKRIGIFPMTSIKDAVYLFAWSLGIGTILITVIFKGTTPILGFSSPIILILIVVSILLKRHVHELSPIFNTDIFPIHVFLSIIAYGLFALSFITSVMYLFQEKWLKHRRIIWLTKWLPSLFVLDDLDYKTLTIGLPFLTLGILTGALWADRAFSHYWTWDPKETWSLIIWLAYVISLHGRISLGWRGKKFAIVSIVCFLFVIFGFIGVNFIFKGFHNF